MKKRILSLLLAGVMAVGALPVTALAEEGPPTEKPPMEERPVSVTSGPETSCYTDIAQAVAAAASGSTVTLLADLTCTDAAALQFSSDTPRALTLDLNGHTLSAGGSICAHYTDLSIIDSGGGGQILFAAGEGFCVDPETASIQLYGGSYPGGFTAGGWGDTGDASGENTVASLLPDGYALYGPSGELITSSLVGHAVSGGVTVKAAPAQAAPAQLSSTPLAPAYTSPYTAVFDGFEQRPTLQELCAGLEEELAQEELRITGYGNNLNATKEPDLAYAEVERTDGSGAAKIYFSIAPYRLSNATPLKSIAKYNLDETALSDLLAIESEDGRYVIPAGSIALRQVNAYTEWVSGGDGYAYLCFYISSAIMDLGKEGDYAYSQSGTRGNETRYFIVSNSENFATDDSSVAQGHWGYGYDQDGRNNAKNQIFYSLSQVYFPCSNDMRIAIGDFTSLGAVSFTGASFPYPDYDEGEADWGVSTGTEGVEVKRAVCSLIVNKAEEGCRASYQVDLYFLPTGSYRVTAGTTASFLSQEQAVRFDPATGWYRSSFPVEQTAADHDWTQWQNMPYTDGITYRYCLHCGREEMNGTEGGLITVTAPAEPGKKFSRWEWSNGSPDWAEGYSQRSDPAKFTADTARITLTPCYEDVAATLTTAGGTVTPLTRDELDEWLRQTTDGTGALLKLGSDRGLSLWGDRSLPDGLTLDLNGSSLYIDCMPPELFVFPSCTIQNGRVEARFESFHMESSDAMSIPEGSKVSFEGVAFAIRTGPQFDDTPPSIDVSGTLDLQGGSVTVSGMGDPVSVTFHVTGALNRSCRTEMDGIAMDVAEGGTVKVTHDWGAPSYTWFSDNSTCTAQRVCLHDQSHTEAETVNSTAKVTQSKTCTLPERTAYTAAFANAAFAQQTKADVQTAEATGHSWGAPTYTWSGDNSTCTARRVCLHDQSHTEAETVNSTAKVTLNKTCTLPERTAYTAAFANAAFTRQTKADVQTAPAAGHIWGEWKVTQAPTPAQPGREEHRCQTCGYIETREIPMLTPDTPDKPGTDTPQTGDNSHTILWASLLLASWGGLAVLRISQKRNQENDQ